MRVHAEAPRVVGDVVVLVAVDPGDVRKTVMVLSKLRISNKEKKKKDKDKPTYACRRRRPTGAVVVVAVDIVKVKGKRNKKEKRKRKILTGGCLWTSRAVVVTVDAGGHWPTRCGGDR